MPFGGLLTAGLISGGTSLLGGLFGSHAASTASKQQQQAEQQAIQQWQQFQQQNGTAIAPYASAGTGGLQQLQALLGKGAPTFTAPTGVTMQNDPGYQFRMDQGRLATEQSAAAHGGALGGGELKALEEFGQNYGSSEYGNVYNRALQGYGANLQGYQTNLGGLQSLANLGLTGTGMGMQSNLAAGTGITQALTGAGNAAAAGTVGGANAWTGALGGFGNNISQMTMLNSMLNKPTTGSYSAPLMQNGGVTDPAALAGGTRDLASLYGG